MWEIRDEIRISELLVNGPGLNPGAPRVCQPQDYRLTSEWDVAGTGY